MEEDEQNFKGRFDLLEKAQKEIVCTCSALDLSM